MDRNGVLLASSVPAPSIWASPEDIDRDPTKLRELARLLEMTPAELNKKLKDEEKTFVWLRRQLDEPIAKQILALGIKGVYDIKEYKRLYPEGESAAHIVGFTNVEDKGQEGIELIFQNQLAGKSGSRRVIKDRLGQVVFGVNTFHSKQVLSNLKAGQQVELTFGFVANLGPGHYSVTVALHQGPNHVQSNFDWLDQALRFEVINVGKTEFVGVSWLPHDLRIRHE